MEGRTNVGEDVPQNVQPAKGQDIKATKTNMEALKYLLALATERAGEANATSTTIAHPGTAADPPTMAQEEDNIPKVQDDEDDGGVHKPG